MKTQTRYRWGGFVILVTAILLASAGLSSISRRAVLAGGAGAALKTATTLGLTKATNTVTHKVQVNADGTFTPQYVFINDGDVVEWQLGNTLHSIIPVDTEGAQDICSAYKPYHPNGQNEFTGPMPRTASGLFTLGPDGPGFVVKSGEAQCTAKKNECDAASVGSGATMQCLCKTGEPYATMDSTWIDPDITGVFIRLRWKDVHIGPGQFDWTAMDHEIAKAVQNGKLYSLAFKAGAEGTPEWIFDLRINWPPARVGIAVTPHPRGVRRIEFQDHGGGAKGDEEEDTHGDPCGRPMALGSPADEVYRAYYFDLLSAAADHIRANNAWYRALAYIKPSGVNLFSHENRAPKNCDAGCAICNTEKWAHEGDYTPSKLYEFYQLQTDLLAEKLPDKDMSYMLIQAGFPLVNEAGEYLGQPEPIKAALPFTTEQTAHIIADGIRNYGARFVVQHNGLGPMCDQSQDENQCAPNYMAVNNGKQGQIIGFQTNNKDGVANGAELEAAFQNGYCNSKATFFEIYEERLWETRMETGGVLDPNAVGSAIAGCRLPIGSNRTFASWAAMLHDRRAERGDELNLPAAFPLKHSHTFKRTATGDVQAFPYVQGMQCTADKFGMVTIVPVTSSTTKVAGYDQIGPPQKPTPATVHALPAVTTNPAVALNEISVSESGNDLCALSVSFRSLPGQTEPTSSLTIHSTWSGPVVCQSSQTIGTAKFTDGQHFVHGIRVCTSGAIPRLQGVEIIPAKVAADGAVSHDAHPNQRFVASGCNTWSPARYCPPGEVAVGVMGYFTDASGFSGIALQCRALRAS